jgi:hypothetical protein
VLILMGEVLLRCRASGAKRGVLPEDGVCSKDRGDARGDLFRSGSETEWPKEVKTISRYGKVIRIKIKRIKSNSDQQWKK